jgi:hypothetical protein
MLSDFRDAIEQLVIHDLPLREPGLYLHKDLTRFRAITTIPDFIAHVRLDRVLKVNTAMAAGLEPTHQADHLFSDPDASDSSVRGAAKSTFIQRDRPSRLADRTARTAYKLPTAALGKTRGRF